MVRRNGRPIWPLMFAALAALAIAMPVVAQMGGMVKGVVVDDKNQPVEGAKVTITMTDTARPDCRREHGQPARPLSKRFPSVHGILLAAPRRSGAILQRRHDKKQPIAANYDRQWGSAA